MMTQDTREQAARDHRSDQAAIHHLVQRAQAAEAAQVALLGEFEALANQLGPLSSQRVRVWVANRRARLGREVTG